MLENLICLFHDANNLHMSDLKPCLYMAAVIFLHKQKKVPLILPSKTAGNHTSKDHNFKKFPGKDAVYPDHSNRGSGLYLKAPFSYFLYLSWQHKQFITNNSFI